MDDVVTARGTSPASGAAPPAPEHRSPVVLATDGGPQARTAERLLTTIADPDRVFLTVIGVAVSSTAAREDGATGDADARRAVEDAHARLAARHFALASHVTHGDPAACIAEMARGRSARLVVMGARPWHDIGLDRLVRRHGRDRAAAATVPDDPALRANRRTSASRRVLREAERPTLAVRTFAVADPPDRVHVLVAYDGSRAADAGVAALIDVADPGRIDVRVVEVREPHSLIDTVRSEQHDAAAGDAPHSTVADEAHLHAVRRHLHDAQRLHTITERLAAAGFDVRADMLEGRPEELLIDLVVEDPVDVVVVGSRGLGTLRRALEGSVSDAMLRVAPATLVAPDPGVDTAAD